MLATWLFAAAVKAAVLLAAAWLGAAVLRHRAPAARHQLWALGTTSALILPLLTWALASLPSLLSLAWTPPLAMSALDLPAFFISAEQARGQAAPLWPTALAVLWAAGTALVLLRLLRDHLAARRLRRAACTPARPPVPAAWISALAEVVEVADRAAAAAHGSRIGRLGRLARTQLHHSDAISSPMTLGLWRAHILLPSAAFAWPPSRLRAVLLHELGHVRRRDTLVQLISQLTCALYWWNPLAWHAAARLRAEREHACDDLVLDAGVLPSSYAADLLEIATSLSTPHLVRGGIFMADDSDTKTRLLRILDAGAPRQPLGTGFRLAAATGALALLATLACTTPAPSSPPEAAAPSTAAASSTDAKPSLTAGAPSIRPWSMLNPETRHGSIDLATVGAEVNRLLPDISRCYERRRAERPQLTGTIVAHTVILETGRVADVCITRDTAGDHELTACLNELLKNSSFQPPRGGTVDVSIPFTFGATTT